ncbi:hypothetical protein [uncultured Dubosiella sp.]|uniref:hypothetical protein n=1 Tax=uncultured Dubosiella sp. TaxID=1937011 RepID=UPI00260B8D08|nr:hypothetical protein [uncultured Dubosiella sp.]
MERIFKLMLLFNAIYLAIAYFVGKRVTLQPVSFVKAGLFLSAEWLFVSVGNCFGQNYPGTILILVSFIGMYSLLFRMDLIQSIALGSILFIFNAIAEFLSLSIMDEFWLNGQSDINSAIYIAALGLSTLFFLAGSLMLIKGFRFVRYYSIPQYWWILIFVPISTIIMFLSVKDYFQMVGSNQMVLIVFLMSAGSNIILLFLYVKAVSSLEIEKKLLVQEQKENDLKSKIEFLDQQYKTNFSFIHDLLQQENEISSFIQNGEKEKAIEALESLGQLTFREFNGILSESNVLNALMAHFQAYIHQNHFHLKTTIAMNDFDFMCIADQYECFYNLLKAIFDLMEYREDQNDRIISIKCKHIRAYRKIECIVPLGEREIENPYSKEFIQKYNIEIFCEKIPKYKKDPNNS